MISENPKVLRVQTVMWEFYSVTTKNSANHPLGSETNVNTNNSIFFNRPTFVSLHQIKPFLFSFFTNQREFGLVQINLEFNLQ